MNTIKLLTLMKEKCAGGVELAIYGPCIDGKPLAEGIPEYYRGISPVVAREIREKETLVEIRLYRFNSNGFAQILSSTVEEALQEALTVLEINPS